MSSTENGLKTRRNEQNIIMFQYKTSEDKITPKIRRANVEMPPTWTKEEVKIPPKSKKAKSKNIGKIKMAIAALCHKPKLVK